MSYGPDHGSPDASRDHEQARVGLTSRFSTAVDSWRHRSSAHQLHRRTRLDRRPPAGGGSRRSPACCGSEAPSLIEQRLESRCWPHRHLAGRRDSTKSSTGFDCVLREVRRDHPSRQRPELPRRESIVSDQRHCASDVWPWAISENAYRPPCSRSLPGWGFASRASRRSCCTHGRERTRHDNVPKLGFLAAPMQGVRAAS